jgi:hypothetical protein
MLLGDREAAERSLAAARLLGGNGDAATLDALEARYNPLQVHGKVRAGFLYDSNANLGPGTSDISLGNWRLKVDGAEAKETFGAYLGADMDVGWRPHRDGSWWLVGDVQSYWRGNSNSELRDSRSWESQWLRGAVGARHLTAATLAEIRLKAEVFDYEFYQNVASYGLEGSFLWAASPAFHLIVRGGIDQRDYSHDPLRDGQYGWAGLYGRVFFGQKNHEVMLGGRYLGGVAKKTDYGYNGWEATARFTLKLPHGFELAPSIAWIRENYKGPATVLELEKRRDERLRGGLGLTYRINETWAMEGNWQYTKNHSNSGLYEYDQHYTNLGVVWSF